MSSVLGSGDIHQFTGVKKVELFKKIWSRKDQILLFTGILSTILYILQTSLLPMYSKLADIVGRPEAYSLSILLYLISFAIMATANNYEALVGGKIIYALGYSGISILGHILIGDMTNVVNRGIYQSLYSLPYLINLFIASTVADEFLKRGQWRWAYGLNCILLVVTGAPLIIGLWHVQWKLKHSGLLETLVREQEEQPKTTFWERCRWLIIEIDLIGSILLVAGLCLILLPLVLAIPRWGGWSSGLTIGTLLGGVLCWILFVYWEWKVALKPIIPLAKWESRTPIYGVLVVSIISLTASANWQYLSTYLQISRGVDAKTAIFLECGYNVAYILMEVIVGLMMARFKIWRLFVWSGIAIILVGFGIMIPARLPESSNAFVVISQAVVGFGNGMLFTPVLVAVQSSVPHDDLAIVTALFQVGGSIAISIGSTIAGALWNSMLPQKLAEYVPGDYSYLDIIGSIDYVLALPEEQYRGVVKAYGEVQKTISIIALGITVLCFFFAAPMQSFGLDENSPKIMSQDDSNALNVSRDISKA
ncbi:major facilitator superfamily domain-containing protein [Spinellus fusiger]|nr:major facilitator superfamily domain-containing protein [Spinellus fusiger]